MVSRPAPDSGPGLGSEKDGLYEEHRRIDGRKRCWGSRNVVMLGLSIKIYTTLLGSSQTRQLRIGVLVGAHLLRGRVQVPARISSKQDAPKTETDRIDSSVPWHLE